MGELANWRQRLAQWIAGSGDSAPQAGERPFERMGSGRIADVGWLLDTPKAGFIWEAPRRIDRGEPVRNHAKSVSFCPAVVDYDARMLCVPCPIDAQVGFRRDAKGVPTIVNLDGDRSAIRSKHLGQMTALVSEKEWRHPERPIIQFVTPYVFLADEPVWMTQLPPITHYRSDPWPGVVIGGRLPIHIWPRQMMWAFEWWDTSKPISLKRGEPWFYVRFDTIDPTRHTRLFEAAMTPELREYVDGLSSVANYVDQTFSLFRTAQERRPDRLLVRKQRGGKASEVVAGENGEAGVCPVQPQDQK